MTAKTWPRDLALIAICAVSTALIYLVLVNAAEKDMGPAIALLLGGIIAVWISAELWLTNDRRYSSFLSVLRSPRGLARFALVMIGSPLAASQALPLFEPGPLTKDDVAAVLKENLPDDNTAGNGSRIVARLPGLWGEQGCKVAYRFTLVPPRGLIIDWERRPAGEAPWRATATLLSAAGDVAETRGESPEDQKGVAATFTYQSNGVNEYLLWDYHSDDPPLKLDRCT